MRTTTAILLLAAATHIAAAPNYGSYENGPCTWNGDFWANGKLFMLI